MTGSDVARSEWYRYGWWFSNSMNSIGLFLNSGPTSKGLFLGFNATPMIDRQVFNRQGHPGGAMQLSNPAVGGPDHAFLYTQRPGWLEGCWKEDIAGEYLRSNNIYPSHEAVKFCSWPVANFAMGGRHMAVFMNLCIVDPVKGHPPLHKHNDAGKMTTSFTDARWLIQWRTSEHEQYEQKDLDVELNWWLTKVPPT
jgi:hypothetical protein